MRILTYKRTHVGDPDSAGCFGVHDCMGRARGWDFEAVIGVGGLGAEPRRFGIDQRVNWVGIGAHKRCHPKGHGVVVTFDTFRLLEARGPFVRDLAPSLARHLYDGSARFLLDSYSSEEQAEAERIVEWAMSQPSGPTGSAPQAERVIVCKPRCQKPRTSECC